MRSSNSLRLSCHVQVCSIKSKCIQHICPEILSNNYNNFIDENPIEITLDDEEENTFLEFKSVSINFIIENYGGYDGKIHMKKYEELSPYFGRFLTFK